MQQDQHWQDVSGLPTSATNSSPVAVSFMVNFQQPAPVGLALCWHKQGRGLCHKSNELEQGVPNCLAASGPLQDLIQASTSWFFYQSIY